MRFAIAIAALCLSVSCGSKEGASGCEKAAERARKCAADLCKAGTLDAYDQKAWCGETSLADDPRVKECKTSRCSEQMVKHTEHEECQKVLNGFSNALEIACE